MTASKIEYILEFSDEHGDGLSEDSIVTSATPLPIPNRGEVVHLPTVSATVLRREFRICDGGNVIGIQVQLFCRAFVF